MHEFNKNQHIWENGAPGQSWDASIAMKKKVEKFRVAIVQILKRKSTAKKKKPSSAVRHLGLKRFRPGAAPPGPPPRRILATRGLHSILKSAPSHTSPPLRPGGEEDEEKRSRLLLPGCSAAADRRSGGGEGRP